MMTSSSLSPQAPDMRRDQTQDRKGKVVDNLKSSSLQLRRCQSPSGARKTVSSYAIVESIKDSISFSYNSLPWYCKKRLIYQLNELRKRLEYVAKDSHFLQCRVILPSSIPTKLRSGTRFHSSTSTIDGHQLPVNVQGSTSVAVSQRVPRFSGIQKALSTSKGVGVRRNVGNGKMEDEKENNQVMAKIRGKRNRVLRVLSGRRKEKPANTRTAATQRRSSLSSSSSKTASWFYRPDNSPKSLPAFCSMEMISFDADTECFHRTEIAYPFQQQHSAATHKKNDTRLGETKSAEHSNRRLAKKVEIRTAAVNNIYKHSLIWE